MKHFDYIAPEFEPINAAEADLFAQEDFVADIQILLHRMMVDKKVSRADLAKRMGVSKPRVSQYFGGDGSNLTARTLARIFNALGEQPELACNWVRFQAKAKAADVRKRSISASEGSVIEMKWDGGQGWCQHGNDNCTSGDNFSALIAVSRARGPVYSKEVAG